MGKAGNGPSPESRVDLIDTIFRTEIGNEKAGFISEMRMRSLDPTVNGNTVGLATCSWVEKSSFMTQHVLSSRPFS